MKSIQHYEIKKKIGSGGMGEVYQAFDTKLERTVALKIIHKFLTEDERNNTRLLNEARAAAKLVHPNVVTIHEIGEYEDGYFIVMEHIEGKSLSQLIYNNGAIENSLAIDYTCQILSALSKAHEMGILHRDIKPDNILITKDNTVKILDFGIAKMDNKQEITIAGEILGTVEFMAPEQILGEKVDARSDLYAVGVMLYQILTRQLPFSGNNAVEILFNKLNEEAIPPSDQNKLCIKQLNKPILKAIRPDKVDRWEDADSFAQALKDALSSANNVSETKNIKGEIIYNPDDDEVIATEDDLHQVFIGREQELKKLLAMYSRAKTGHGKTVIISGEAGVGKSRLTKQLDRAIHHHNNWTLYGACLYQDGMDSYLPFIDSLRTFFSRENTLLSEQERLQLKEMVRQVAPMLSEFTEHFTTTIFSQQTVDATGPSATNNFIENLNALIGTMAEIKPVILVIDDLQWADEASLRLFHYLARQISHRKVLLIGINRTDKYDLRENGKPKMIVDMLARMSREDLYTQLILDRLKKDNCDMLIDRALGATAFTDEFYDRLFQETKGNPFFVIETLKLLKSKGVLENKDDLWTNSNNLINLEVPDRVEDILIRRLNALEESEREILQVAAILGKKFDPALLSSLLEIPKITLLKKLHHIEREIQLVNSSNSHFHFEHPMLADLLYNEVPAPLCREYHLMIVQEMEHRLGDQFGAMVGEVAYHARQGGDHEKAYPLLYKAAERAFDISAFKEACIFYSDFLDSIKKSETGDEAEYDMINLYYKLGISYEETGNWKEALKYFREMGSVAQSTENKERYITSLLRKGRIYDKLGDWKLALDAYHECHKLAEKNKITNVLSRVYNKLGIYFFHIGDYDRAIDHFRKTIRSVDSDLGKIDEAHAYTNLGVIANIMRGDNNVALKNFEKAIEIYELLDRKKDVAQVYHNIGMVYSDRGNWLESIKAFEKCQNLADKADARHLKALTNLNMGKAYARQKKLTRAMKYTDKAFNVFKRMADELSMAEAFQIYGLIKGMRGNLNESERDFNKAISMFNKKHYQDGLAEAYENLAQVYIQSGKTDQAIDHFQNAIEIYKGLKLDVKATDIKNQLTKLEELNYA